MIPPRFFPPSQIYLARYEGGRPVEILGEERFSERGRQMMVNLRDDLLSVDSTLDLRITQVSPIITG